MCLLSCLVRSLHLANLASRSTVGLSLGLIVEWVGAEAVGSPGSASGGRVGVVLAGLWVSWVGGASSTGLLAVGVHERLKIDRVADGDVVGTVWNRIDASTVVAESTSGWAVLGNEWAPNGREALGSRDGITVHAGD